MIHKRRLLKVETAAVTQVRSHWLEEALRHGQAIWNHLQGRGRRPVGWTARLEEQVRRTVREKELGKVRGREEDLSVAIHGAVSLAGGPWPGLEAVVGLLQGMEKVAGWQPDPHRIA